MTTPHPVVAITGAIRSFPTLLQHERAVFGQHWPTIHGHGLSHAQACLDAVPEAAAALGIGMTAAQLMAASRIQAGANNATQALLDDPAAVADPDMQALIAALDTLAAREDLPRPVRDSVPFSVGYNPDGSVSLAELPEEEPES